MAAARQLVVLWCSDKKSDAPGALPAIERYTGTVYNVLRNYLRKSLWPESLSVAVLSAKYGLIGGLTSIANYDQRMDARRAAELMRPTTETLLRWAESHDRVSLVLGRDYLPALDFERLRHHRVEPIVLPGGIGEKQHHWKALLDAMERVPRPKPAPVPIGRTLYFLPDWDDMLDMDYNFAADQFSAQFKAERAEQHCVKAMQPNRMCDGVLISLAQHLGSKGVLKKFEPTDVASLAPGAMRTTFGLTEDQWVFGDCGAFTYAKEPVPTITPQQAVSLYQIYGFDFGASVNHIPLPEIEVDGGKVALTDAERRGRVRLTCENAAQFIALHKQNRCTFTPVGVIQGLTPENYASQLSAYADMGYAHVALGGLVPKSDAEILATVTAIGQARARLGRELWIHLFGVFRPRIQPELRAAGITSFDSATYFRKAWLRSDQNYLAANGQWYAAIRVPMTSDPRTLLRLKRSGRPLDELVALEQATLQALHNYGLHQLGLEPTLRAIESYDFILSRSVDHGKNLMGAYRRTLVERPWEMCQCSMCKGIGIDVVIFRGSNRNKRRGAHNTLMLFRSVGKG